MNEKRCEATVREERDSGEGGGSKVREVREREVRERQVREEGAG